MAARRRGPQRAGAARKAGAGRHCVVVGGGLQGAAAAYFLAKRGAQVTVVELEQYGSAASGKAGGFLARDWGSGPTVPLHTEGFRLHAELADELGLETYRKIPTLSVASGNGREGLKLTDWLDGSIANARIMDTNTAQVTPLEITTKLAAAAADMGAQTVIGRAKGVVSAPDGAASKVEAVRVEVAGQEEELVLGCSDVLVAMGVWSTLTAPWFGLEPDSWPITGIKSTHTLWRAGEAVMEEPAALFCGEEANGTHLEIYPRSNGDLYACGIGGSDYVEDRARLAVGGDCEKPSAVQADMTRVSAAVASASKLTSLISSSALPETVGACMRPCPPDALPFMGQVPEYSNAFISAGHNCWGILWGPLSGKLMAEVILDGQAKTVDLSAFSPERFLVERRGRGRKKGSEPVGEQW